MFTAKFTSHHFLRRRSKDDSLAPIIDPAHLPLSPISKFVRKYKIFTALLKSQPSTGYHNISFKKCLSPLFPDSLSNSTSRFQSGLQLSVFNIKPEHFAQQLTFLDQRYLLAMSPRELLYCEKINDDSLVSH